MKFGDAPPPPAPSLRDDLRAAGAAYNGALTLGDGWLEVEHTPTVRAWRRGTQVLLSIRGTVDATDVKADGAVAVTRLSTSQRYRTDLATVKALVARLPYSEYYVTSHSLGGAIAIQLQRDLPYIRSGVFFNGALQPRDVLHQVARDLEVYDVKDPLYRVGGGRYWRNKRVVDSGAASTLAAHGVGGFEGRLGGGDSFPPPSPSIAGVDFMARTAATEAAAGDASATSAPLPRGMHDVEEWALEDDGVTITLIGDPDDDGSAPIVRARRAMLWSGELYSASMASVA